MGWPPVSLRTAIPTNGNSASNRASSLRSLTQLLSRRWLASAMRVNLSCQYTSCFPYSWRSVKLVTTTTVAMHTATPYEYRRDGSDGGENLGILPEVS